MPVFFDGERVNLGDWDNDGDGSLLLMMSGVYSIIKGEIAKTTFRGSYSMFIDHRDENNELRYHLFPQRVYGVLKNVQLFEICLVPR